MCIKDFLKFVNLFYKIDDEYDYHIVYHDYSFIPIKKDNKCFYLEKNYITSVSQKLEINSISNHDGFETKIKS